MSSRPRQTRSYVRGVCTVRHCPGPVEEPAVHRTGSGYCLGIADGWAASAGQVRIRSVSTISDTAVCQPVSHTSAWATPAVVSAVDCRPSRWLYHQPGGGCIRLTLSMARTREETRNSFCKPYAAISNPARFSILNFTERGKSHSAIDAG